MSRADHPVRSLPRPLRAGCATARQGATLLAWVVNSAWAQPALPAVEIRGPRAEPLQAASQGSVDDALLAQRPLQRPGALLEAVPGLVVTQHSGEGKAHQYFLRGFNLDHGTDFATHVDGMPVNLPSHAHGQGYTDLNFVIPELVERLDYRKGPAFADEGDFAAAGAAHLHLRQRLEAPFVQFTLGQHGHRRGVAATGLALSDDTHWLGAAEWTTQDGPWTVPAALHRRNLQMTLAHGTAARGASLTVLDHASQWNATDQVPERALTAGLLGRYDTLDASDGGRTARSSLSGEWHQRDATRATRLQAYALRYRLALFSNFTYAMERPASGDQFLQQDDRQAFGLRLTQAQSHPLGGHAARTEIGLQARRDLIDLALADTQARQVIGTTRIDRVQHTLLGVWLHTQLTLAPWLQGVAGVRADEGRFAVTSRLQPLNSGQARGHQVSPKLALIATLAPHTTLFFNTGRGLHSNDARGTTAQVDPRSAEPVQRVPVFAAARGHEIGLRSTLLPTLQTTLALWRLGSASELVYVGDAGSTEPRGASHRRGVEWSSRWAPHPHLAVEADLAWTRARFDNGEHIPNAVDRVASLAVLLRDLGPWSAALHGRFIGSGALVEDNHLRSRPSTTFDLRLTRTLHDLPAAVTLDVFNLVNRHVDDIAYFYASRLPGEATAVADRHLHPAEPRTLRLTWRQRF